MDLIFFTSILNIIWYIGSVLFLIYRYTSLFTYMYYFVIFCVKLGKKIIRGVQEITLYLRRRSGYIKLSDSEGDEEYLLPNRNQSWFSRFLSKTTRTITRCFNWFSRNRVSDEELAESTESIPLRESQQPRRYDPLESQLNKLCADSTLSFKLPQQQNLTNSTFHSNYHLNQTAQSNLFIDIPLTNTSSLDRLYYGQDKLYYGQRNERETTIITGKTYTMTDPLINVETTSEKEEKNDVIDKLNNVSKPINISSKLKASVKSPEVQSFYYDPQFK